MPTDSRRPSRATALLTMGRSCCKPFSKPCRWRLKTEPAWCNAFGQSTGSMSKATVFDQRTVCCTAKGAPAFIFATVLGDALTRVTRVARLARGRSVALSVYNWNLSFHPARSCKSSSFLAPMQCRAAIMPPSRPWMLEPTMRRRSSPRRRHAPRSKDSSQPLTTNTSSPRSIWVARAERASRYIFAE